MKRIALQIVCLLVGLLSTTIGLAEDTGTPRIEAKPAAPAPQLHTTLATPVQPVLIFEMPKWVPQLGLAVDADLLRFTRFVDAPLVDLHEGLERELSPPAEYSDPLRAPATAESSILSLPASMEVISPDARFLRGGSMTFGMIRVDPVGQFSNR